MAVKDFLSKVGGESGPDAARPVPHHARIYQVRRDLERTHRRITWLAIAVDPEQRREEAKDRTNLTWPLKDNYNLGVEK